MKNLLGILKGFGTSSTPETDGLTDITRLKENAAKLLRTSPEALAEFEKAYRLQILDNPDAETGGLFDTSAKQVKQASPAITDTEDSINALFQRIVNELLEQTVYIAWDGNGIESSMCRIPDDNEIATPVTLDEIMAVPEAIRPQLAGNLIKKDIGEPTYLTLLDNYQKYLTAGNAKDAKLYYNMFRQGLDILDLDPVTYQIIATNRNSIGNWFPALGDAVLRQDFFKIPKTRIIRVPLPLLQLSRLEYTELTPGTMRILDQFCMEAFDLNTDKEYFVKTGVFSSKFDFRNAHVHGAKEVTELGEYLLFIHNQSVIMAGPMYGGMYGAATTVDWVVREFIPDPENNPTIYKGLPLRTEYRVFADVTAGTILGITPYWRSDVMKQRFGHAEDANSPHQIHDYITYTAAEPALMARYETNHKTVVENIKAMLPDMRRSGLREQWSIDVMQSGQDFYIIDMALANTSALNDCCGNALITNQEDISMPQIRAPKRSIKS